MNQSVSSKLKTFQNKSVGNLHRCPFPRLSNVLNAKTIGNKKNPKRVLSNITASNFDDIGPFVFTSEIPYSFKNKYDFNIKIYTRHKKSKRLKINN